jgi:3-hydroxyacyl-CoA dehydrogenase
LKLFLVLQPLRKYWTSYYIRREILGKTAVVAKDTPAFIGNRIGIFGIQSLFHLVKEMGLTIEEVDKLPVIGRPKSATLEQLMLLV